MLHNPLEEADMSRLFRTSEIASRMQPSPIRELFKTIQQPGMISFAGGLPDPDAFPVEAFADCADVLADDGRRVLQYGASEGFAPLREILIETMTARIGVEVRPDELLVTSGSQQGVNLTARCLLDPGDVVVVEAPTYPGTIHSLRNAGARFATIPCDADGMRVELLPDTVAAVEAATGNRPKLVYSVPDFSNPSGACLSLERRHRLVELAGKLEIPVFEDDPYGKLRYSGKPLPTLKELAAGGPEIIYASSFSKILAPGVRVAWTVAEPELTRAMVLMRQGEDLCTSTVTQALVAEYCRRGHLEDHMGTIIDVYAAKCRAMQRGLVAHLPDGAATWTEPAGGFFYWLELASGSARELFDRAAAENVAFVPGGAFYPDVPEQVGNVHAGDRFARLCFTFADEESIDEGCRRLGRVLGK
ncbi:MAG: PLP-dependent aminotransferase family protein [Thermoanaerobaculales bacterium]|jgi:2-aminoadipate transaminase|nr:PLP-dependent aminotransferase family protein [Thermoanaerobaculales bacterium]